MVTGWFEVETRYWVVRLHAAPTGPSFGRVFFGVCGWSSLVLSGANAWVGLVWGCFLRTA